MIVKMGANSIEPRPSRFVHLVVGIVGILAGWYCQVLIMIPGIYLFGFIMYTEWLDDATFAVLLRYIALPLSTIIPSVIVIKSARHISQHVANQGTYLQWLQPSLGLAAFFMFVSPGEDMSMAAILVFGLSGFIPVLLFGRRETDKDSEQ